MPRYFQKVGSGFDVAPAVDELEHLGTTGKDDGVSTVPLYQHPMLGGVGVQNTRYAAAHAVFGAVVEALGNPDVYAAVLRLLPPKSKIPKHQDGLTATAPRRRRYHLALQADEQSWFVIRDERCRFNSGELWHVDLLNRPHYVVNNSDRPRVMLMVDAFEGPLDEAAIRRVHQHLRQTFGDDWERKLQLAARDWPFA